MLFICCCYEVVERVVSWWETAEALVALRTELIVTWQIS